MMFSASTEIDILVAGEVAKQVHQSVDLLFNEVSGNNQHYNYAGIVCNILQQPKHDHKSKIDEIISRQNWTDSDCRAAYVRSHPSSNGEDAILQQVLNAVRGANKSVIVSSGHSNIPRVLAKAFAEATSRYVRVQILVNSWYTCDLRGGQRDLFRSLQDLLDIAPNVEVYATAPIDVTTNAKEPVVPPFLHAKYVVVDGIWSAIGSWNMWTRASYFEIEHEVFIDSPLIANLLSKKFEHEKKCFTVHLCAKENCIEFCPKGCCLCKGFGPFFK